MLQYLKSDRDQPRANIIALLLATCLCVTAVRSHAAEQPRSRITWDAHSLKIDEQRIFVWGGEMHPFRLPSPSLWRDVLEKMKASGYNTVAFYFAWGYHSPKQGVYDFSGVRDMDRLLRMAKEVGLYVIVRPGPYMNAEVTRGGFPSWLVTQAARARTDAPEYMTAADEWLTQINSIIKRHQLTDGGGNVILYQIENELDLTSPAHQRYMQHLHQKVRSDGITVPIFHNDKGRNGYWVPASSKVPGVVHGPVDLYAFDAYPGGSCNVDATPGTPNSAPDFGLYSAGGAKGGATASPSTPGFTAEFGGGWFDYWGSNDTYPCTAIRNGPGYQRVFYGTNIANALTIQSFYMTFGGTSWGWLPAPVVFTSYDYGAAIDEARRLRDKAQTMKQLGQFIEAVKPLREMRKGELTRASTPAVKIYHNLGQANAAPQDTNIYVAMHEPSNATTNDAFTFPIATFDGRYVVPQQGTLRIAGQDAKILLASYDMERQRLVYSTSELQTHLRLDDHDLALLYGRRNEDGETVLRFGTQPRVELLSGSLSHTFDAESGDLRLNYTHGDLLRVRISEGGRAPLMLLIAAEDIAQTFWRQHTSAGAVIERGPALVRSATIVGSRLHLKGDTDAQSELEIWAPARVETVTWNGKAVPVKRTNLQSLLATRNLDGPATIDLPDLSRSAWKFHPGSPESDPGFDDSSWTTADLARTNGPTKPPAGQPVLTMDDYGFHHGDVWYRGRYSGNEPADTLTLHWGGGGAGLIQVWIDGVFVGQDEHATGLPRPPTTGVTTIRLEKGSALPRGQEDHVIAVMVRNNSHNWDLDADDAHKEGRGLISASLSSSTGKSFSVPIRWKIQGHLGAEHLPDPTRGPLNNGGSHGERMGWHLPGFATDDWSTTGLIPDRQTQAGTSWYRTEFDLAVPMDHDLSLGLSIGHRSALRSRGRYRVLIFLNGWNVGQFIAHVGPQRTFVLPNGILNLRGRNTLALAVTADGAPESYLESVELVQLHSVRGGVPLEAVTSPSFQNLNTAFRAPSFSGE
jgi:beta-galactosidase GanA